jgi:hypothetical protein
MLKTAGKQAVPQGGGKATLAGTGQRCDFDINATELAVVGARNRVKGGRNYVLENSSC